MAHLFANLDQQGDYRDQVELYTAASRLCTEFQTYIAKTHSLRKVFVSVKGYYYQVSKSNLIDIGIVFLGRCYGYINHMVCSS